MAARDSWRKLLLRLIVAMAITHHAYVEGWLVYPNPTVFQIVTSVSAPITVKDMKFYMDWGLQMNYMLPTEASDYYNSSKWARLSKERAVKCDNYLNSNGLHPADATAGQIYMTIEEILARYGFHETCLLKSVCEVATYPFDLGNENVLAEVINFILSPSLHRAFGKDEAEMKEAYEAAERYGFSGVDCSYIYPECPIAPIDVMTKIEFY